jgi:glutamate N-acetyltransferase / amino-acid N-acetyltransferase
VVCIELAKMIVMDGEGATKLLEVRVKECSDFATAKTLALKVLTSNLVKTAFFGEDANWGRIVTALGNSGIVFDPARVSIYLGDLLVAEDGRGVPLDEERAKEILTQKEIPVTIHMGAGNQEAVAWGCDLSHEYVTINGSYRT